MILPTSKNELFAVSSTHVKFTEASGTKHVNEKPFDTDREAVDSARSWILRNFDKLPNHASLEAVELLRSASGSPKPQGETDRGHTVTFLEKFHGIPTQGGAIVYIAGPHPGLCEDLSLFIPAYSKVRETNRRQDRGDTEMEGSACERGAEKGTLFQFDKRAKPRLVYHWCPLSNRGSDAPVVVAPTWVLDDENKIMVDGQSGKAWTND